MKDSDVTTAFSALGQPKRLEAFKLLLSREPAGLHAGDLAKIMDAPFNTMSAHMAILYRSGLVTADKKGRYITYRVDIPYFAKIMGFLFKDCCDGKPELCSAVFEEFQKISSTPKAKTKGS
jgi:DNA-binding transcriptional ArsR family regulator